MLWLMFEVNVLWSHLYENLQLNRWYLITCVSIHPNHLGLYWLSGMTSYPQISWSLEAARLDVIMIVSLWNLTAISAALLPRCLSNFRAIGKSLNPNLAASKLREICGKTSVRLVNRGAGVTPSLPVQIRWPQTDCWLFCPHKQHQNMIKFIQTCIILWILWAPENNGIIHRNVNFKMLQNRICYVTGRFPFMPRKCVLVLHSPGFWADKKKAVLYGIINKRQTCCWWDVHGSPTWIIFNVRLSISLTLLVVARIWYALNSLTHWGRDKMADILRTTFWNNFFDENVNEIRWWDPSW